ncbi:MAG: hypothetical protein BGO26_04685 [Actinobacteria bacterium 69-20]|nr:MAG: hypothetical protein BGO26_04685 [Actinobacteria bacterium 69-20]
MEGKRRELIAQISALARTHGMSWQPRPGRQRGPHEVFLLGGQVVPIPRHREIGEMLARSIIRQAERIIGEVE